MSSSLPPEPSPSRPVAASRSRPADDSIIEAGLAAPAVAPENLDSIEADELFASQIAAPKPSEWIQKRWVVVLTLFGVTGFLGLPLLWMNRRFSEPERWVWAVLNILYTCGLIYGAYLICYWSYNRVMGY